jgi:hypothetical protein
MSCNNKHLLETWLTQRMVSYPTSIFGYANYINYNNRISERQNEEVLFTIFHFSQFSWLYFTLLSASNICLLSSIHLASLMAWVKTLQFFLQQIFITWFILDWLLWWTCLYVQYVLITSVIHPLIPFFLGLVWKLV